MSRPRFLITIDTEGDNLWSNPRTIETGNARCLPRFQALCERYRLKPTYLVNYEMACCPDFVAFGRDVLRREAGEIGMHLHAWNSPPIEPLTEDDYRFHPYLIEYPAEIMERKIAFMTGLLEDTFARRMVSHRAGRWAFDATYARLLAKFGYAVDCSVTPHVSWRSRKGAPAGRGGSDYRHAPEEPYFIDGEDPRRLGTTTLLEVPMTIRRRSDAPSRWLAHHSDEHPILWRAVDRLRPLARWLRPSGRNRDVLLGLVDEIADGDESHAEFMLHSSELMPGGSPTFRDGAAIERLYEDLECLFAAVQRRFEGATLAEFRGLVGHGAARGLERGAVGA